jgi:hypothetical protein
MDRLIAFFDIVTTVGFVISVCGVIFCIVVARLTADSDRLHFMITGKKVVYHTPKYFVAGVLCGAWILTKYVGV